MNKFIAYRSEQFNIDFSDPSEMVLEKLNRHQKRWEKTEAGIWLFRHSYTLPIWNRLPQWHKFSYTVCLEATLNDADLIYWKLKYE